MSVSLLFLGIFLALDPSIAQVIDIGGVWETTCPQQCSCQISRFRDLPLHQWLTPSLDQKHELLENDGFVHEHPFTDDLLKVATCVISGNPEQLLAKLPVDLQAFTILESGNKDTEIALRSVDLQRFTELISLDIQGMEYDSTNETKKKGIVMTADTLLPLGMSLLYLNLERVTLTSLNLITEKKANLVVEPMNKSKEQLENEAKNRNGHRLIFLSQQSEDNEDKEILPYDIYKQELEGYRETSGLFTGLAVLTHLRLYDCALNDISWHVFDGLENLVFLSLEKNDLKIIPEFCFYGTPKLRTLSLAQNQLLTLSSMDLAGLLMLERLDLSRNNLTFLSELSFPPFPALVAADFTENPFDSIFPSTFEIMNKTARLTLGGNGNSKMQLKKNSFLGLRRLEMLHLLNLGIPLLERYILQGMPILMELKMRGNISRIDFDAFMDLAMLQHLDLSHCQIRKISMDAFYGLKNVRRIDISHNELDFIPPGLFAVQQQTELNEVLLHHNRLTRLPPNFFKNLRNINGQMQIENLRLDGNPWDCTCSMFTWNSHLVNKVRETEPRCFTPKKLRNWGVYSALRKGGLKCRRPKRKSSHKYVGLPEENENMIGS